MGLLMRSGGLDLLMGRVSQRIASVAARDKHKLQDCGQHLFPASVSREKTCSIRGSIVVQPAVLIPMTYVTDIQ